MIKEVYFYTLSAIPQVAGALFAFLGAFVLFANEYRKKLLDGSAQTLYDNVTLDDPRRDIESRKLNLKHVKINPENFGKLVENFRQAKVEGIYPIIFEKANLVANELNTFTTNKFLAEQEWIQQGIHSYNRFRRYYEDRKLITSMFLISLIPFSITVLMPIFLLPLYSFFQDNVGLGRLSLSLAIIFFTISVLYSIYIIIKSVNTE